MCSTLCKSRLLQVSASAQQVLPICSALSPKHNLHQPSKHDLCYGTSDTLRSAPATPGATFVPPLAPLMTLSQLLRYTVLLATVSRIFVFTAALGSTKHGACGPAGGEARQRESWGLKQDISLCESKSNKNGQNL